MVLAWCSTLSMTCERVPRRAVPYCAGPIDSTGPTWYDTADSCEQNYALALGSTLCKLHPYIVIELLRMLHVACRSFLFGQSFLQGGNTPSGSLDISVIPLTCLSKQL